MPSTNPNTGRLLVETVADSGGTGDAVQITDGTNNANILKGDGTAAGQNALLTASSNLEVSFTTTTVQAMGSTDVKDYRWVSVQITSQGGSSTVTFQSSNDNSNWVSTTLAIINGAATIASGVAIASTTSTGIFAGPIQARYFRLNVTGIASGTTAGVIEFQAAASYIPIPDFYGTGGQIQPPMVAQIGGSNGGFLRPINVDTSGNIGVFGSGAGAAATYTHVAAGQATTVIKASAGTLYSITLNSAATATNVTTIYDNASGAGTVIAIPNVVAATVPSTLTFGPNGIAFTLGLTLITTTANGGDMTFCWK